MKVGDLIALSQYSLEQAKKEEVLVSQLNSLTEHHRERCPGYGRILDVIYSRNIRATCLSEVPFLPVGLFKEHRLQSVPEEAVFKVLTSSGTTGQQVSQIVLDRETARRQILALASIMKYVLGNQRLPMLIVDTKDLIKDRTQFSARGAGVLGMINFGRQHQYVLDRDMALDVEAVKVFVRQYGHEPFLIFGFTFMVWQYFYRQIANLGVDLSNGILIHSGGWKKLADEAVDNDEFKARFRTATGLRRIYNFYGMVEQVGSVFLEGEDGYLYAPNFADVVVRDPETWQEVPVGESGVIQVLSTLPLSYPGHSILTEDLGVVHGVDDSRCGRKGKYFSVLGRIPKAELRGCGDTHAAGVRRIS